MNPNYTEYSYTESNYINPINPLHTGKSLATEKKEPDMIDGIDDPNVYVEIIRENIAYMRQLRTLKEPDRELYRTLYELICEIVCVKRESVTVNGVEYPYKLVQSRYLSLDSSHLEYVMDCLNKTSTKITNIRAYLITALFNAPVTMAHSVKLEVQYDMFGGGWAEKGII